MGKKGFHAVVQLSVNCTNTIMDITIWRLPKLETKHIPNTNTPTIKYMAWERNQKKKFIIIHHSYTINTKK